MNTTSFNITTMTDSTIHYPPHMLGFTAACAFIIAVFGTGGNLITIVALLMNKKLRSRSTTILVVNLAVVEMMFCIFILPMSGAQYAFLQLTQRPLLSDKSCIFFTAVRYGMTQAQFQTLIAIALIRVIAVTCTDLFLKIDNPKFVACYIVFIWVYSLSTRIPPAMGKFGRYVFNIETMECDMDREDKFARFVFMLTDAVIPVLFIIILYIIIFVMVKLSSHRVGRVRRESRPSITERSVHSTSGERKFSNPAIQGLRQMVRRESLKAVFSRKESTISQSQPSRRDAKVTRSIFIIFLIVLITSVPVMVLHIINRGDDMPRIFLAAHILYWIQYSLNLYVYVLMNKQYRGAVIDLLARIIPSCGNNRDFIFPWENQSETSKSVNNTFGKKKSKMDCNQSFMAKEEEDNEEKKSGFNFRDLEKAEEQEEMLAKNNQDNLDQHENAINVA